MSAAARARLSCDDVQLLPLVADRPASPAGRSHGSTGGRLALNAGLRPPSSPLAGCRLAADTCPPRFGFGGLLESSAALRLARRGDGDVSGRAEPACDCPGAQPSAPRPVIDDPAVRRCWTQVPSLEPETSPPRCRHGVSVPQHDPHPGPALPPSWPHPMSGLSSGNPGRAPWARRTPAVRAIRSSTSAGAVLSFTPRSG